MDRERLRRIRNHQSDDWYAALVMRPLTILVMLVVADWRWLTPNRLTSLGNVCKLAAALLLLPAAARVLGVGATAAAWIAVVLLQLGLLFDHLDGTVARYRRSFSALGSFYDKTGDIVTWFLVMVALGWRGYERHGDAVLIVLALTSAYALAVRGYMKWLVVAESERLRWHLAAGDPGAAIARMTAAPVFEDAPARSAGDWARWLAGMSIQLYRFEEVDLFFWVGLGVLIDRVDLLCWLLAVTQVIGMVGMMARRVREVARLDAALAPHRAGRGRDIGQDVGQDVG
ncbi:MAG TPA: CDP-alcohol phosphatidyltransferase family protein [Kofleriaceae bacterium]|nr:CDP-alcohol phosphatidyltransferase family protein [Kofleriaceae bacterium]